MKNNIDKNLIEVCYQKSIELLLKNSTKFGVLTSSKSDKALDRNYLSIFGRDASVCALGMIASQNKKLLNIAKNSLLTLAKFQANNGQIPNYVKPEKKEVDWWYFGCIDATLWWLIAVNFYSLYADDKKFKIQTKKNIIQALDWLNCQKHNHDNLIMQNEASDWADIMPRSGKVLYSNILWLKILKEHQKKDFKIANINFNALFKPFSIENNSLVSKRNISLINFINNNRKETNHYLSYVNYRFWGEDIDVYGNSLAIIFDLIEKKQAGNIINDFLKKKRLNNMPTPVLFNPIKEKSKRWQEYMKMHNQNYPNQYHNGGIWPFASTFWAMALTKSGYKEEAWEELVKIANTNQLNNWQFNEWFHAKTGKPMGMDGQSWNAGVFLLAYHYIKRGINL